MISLEISTKCLKKNYTSSKQSLLENRKERILFNLFFEVSITLISKQDKDHTKKTREISIILMNINAKIF